MYYLIALLLGIFLAMQAPINASLGGQINSMPMAALINFLVGSVALIVFCLCSGNFGGIEGRLFADVPLWKYVGGIIGAAFVFFAIILMPKIGASAFIMLAMLGQLVTSMLVDKYGLFNMAVREIGLYRMTGMAIMVFGLLVYFGKDLAGLLQGNS